MTSCAIVGARAGSASRGVRPPGRGGLGDGDRDERLPDRGDRWGDRGRLQPRRGRVPGRLREPGTSPIDAATGALLGSEITFSPVATQPSVAHNPIDDEYLLVWRGDGLGAEILGQRLDAAGNEIGSDDFAISQTQSSTPPPARPDVVHNPLANEYLVVWEANEVVTIGQKEYEIWGQRLDADGNEVGTNDFRISDGGTETSPSFQAWTASVAHNRTDDEYLVVWSGDDDENGHVDNEYEVRGQLLDASGAEIGTNDFTISQSGHLGNSGFDAERPDVVFDPTDGQYLVVFRATDVDSVGRYEIKLQRLSAAGAEIGVDDQVLTDVGTGNSTAHVTGEAVIAWVGSPGALVAYRADDQDLPAQEWRAYGQQIARNGAEQGENDFLVSDVEVDDGVPGFHRYVAAACRGDSGECLIAFQGYDERIYGQRLALVQPVPLLPGGAWITLAALLAWTAARRRRSTQP